MALLCIHSKHTITLLLLSDKSCIMRHTHTETNTHSLKAICAAFEMPAINTLSWQGPQMGCWELCLSRTSFQA